MLRSNNEKTLEFLRQICREEGYPENNPNMLEVLREEGQTISSETTGESRWWSDLTVTRFIRGKFIQFQWAKANRDESLHDIGWEFDWSSVIEVESYPKTVIAFRPIPDEKFEE